ncbi:hypothetical protein MTR_3g099260 [Medicago truncatula]|uniref:Mechanosensitive ion channel protein 2/3 C-terminal domain-containing protein n=1 Tax=Medicago truncatula TaxID=3880 RepID=G7J3W9_MEDTR|nr:hypothetical protein MTR_3g099260 [Medicago truncatula]
MVDESSLTLPPPKSRHDLNPSMGKSPSGVESIDTMISDSTVENVTLSSIPSILTVRSVVSQTSVFFCNVDRVQFCDGEIVMIPTHNFTTNIVRNHTHDGYLNIYIPVERLNITKLKIILTKMCDVLSKSSYVEQEKFHRRVYFDDVPGKGTVRILIDCYLK